MRQIPAGRAVCLAAIAAVAFPAIGPADTGVGDELLTNGGFEKLDGKSWPAGWRGFAGAKARRQKGKTWIELSRYGSCTQEIALDAGWMKLKLAFRMRVTGVVRGDDGWKNARLAMEWRDANGGHVDPWPNVIWAEGTTGWQAHERVFVIPHGAASLQVAPAMFGRPGGKAEYDDISVTLVRKRAARKEDLPVPKGSERSWDLADAWRRRSATRETVCLNGLWRFLPAGDGNAAAPPEGPAGWGWLKVPGVWPRSLEDAPQELLLSPWMEDRTDLSRLDRAWYLRKITVPEGWKRRRTFVDFTMLQTHARVFVDGKPAGERFFPGGAVEITEHVRCGVEQVLAILVTARPLARETTTFMAPERIIKSKASVGLRGLTGDVFLVSRPGGERIDDVRITTSVRHSTIRIDARIAEPGGGPRILRARILEKGKVVKELSSAPLGAADLQAGPACVTASWPGAKLWDTQTPGNLYDAVVGLVDGDGKVLDETLPIRFGFREFRIDGRDFHLNGKRIHLRALNLRNINGEADRARIEACRETCRRLREYGFNFFITANYHFQPGTVSCMDGLFEAADETGVLASFSLPHVKDFAWKLDEPAQAKRYRELCEWLIRRVRHHPSIVMYAMNHNATGYRGDQNPLRIDGVFSPDDPKLGGRPSRNRRQARIAAKIAKSIDPTRPVYHHQSGNLGDLHTVNIYLNWAPKQERSDWLEHWATKGVKPLFFVEWGLPHVSSWSSYRGPNFIWRSEEYQSVWDAEFNAEYLGDEAYELTPARIRSREHEEDLWSRGQPFHWGWLIQHFRNDEDNHVRMKALFADDNWRCLRAWGISAMLPWDQGNLWRQEKNFTGGWRRVMHEPRRLKQPGIVTDRVQASESYLYHPDSNAIGPTALGESFLRWNQPLCAFIGGGPGPNDFTDKAHNFLPGETVRKQLVILNDTREQATCTYSCWALPAAEWKKLQSQGKMPRPQRRGGLGVPPGGKATSPFVVRLRADAEPGRYQIVAQFDFGKGGRQTDRFTFHVLEPPKKLNLKSRVALFDPKGLTASLLDELGVRYEKVAGGADVSKYGILVIGREAIGLTTKLPDLSPVRKGLRVLVFEQTAETLAHRLGFRVNVHGLRRVFLRAGGGPPYLGDEELRDWRGSATLVPPYLPIEGIEKDNPRWRWCGFSNTRVWRCGNRGCVASVLIEKPPVGNFLPVISGGFDLQYAPLLEYYEGRGRVLFCQLDVTGRTETDPAATDLCRGLLRRLDAAKPFWKADVHYTGDKRGAELLRALGIPFERYAGGKLPPVSLLVLGPGGKGPGDLPKALGSFSSVFCLGLSGEEIRRLWGDRVETLRQTGCYGQPVDSPWCGWKGLSNAEYHWRTKLSFDAIGTKPPGWMHASVKVGKDKPRRVDFCQVAPWMLDYRKKPYLRTSYRRNVFLVSRILHNLGAPARTPLLERLSKPAALKAPGAWLKSYYVQEPVAEDDPYRYYRW